MYDAFCTEGSNLSHQWAQRGYSAVRVARREEGKKMKEAPTHSTGIAKTWYLDLEQAEDQRALLEYAAELRPHDIWTSWALRKSKAVSARNAPVLVNNVFVEVQTALHSLPSSA